MVDQELEVGLRSIAVSIRGRGGEVVAAVNVSMRVGLAGADPDRSGDVLPPLFAAAEKISADLSVAR